jgi:hypothetical protein
LERRAAALIGPVDNFADSRVGQLRIRRSPSYEDEQALVSAKTAIEQATREIGWHGQPRPGPKSVTVYEVMRAT